MSFTATIEVQKQVNYSSIGLILPAENAVVEASIEVTGINQLYGSDGVATYVVTVDGVDSAPNSFPFIYSGSGNPVSEAEEQLKAALNV